MNYQKSFKIFCESTIYIKQKSRLSVHIFLVEWISAEAAWIGINLAQNESQALWHQLICFEKFLNAATLNMKALLNTL